MDLPGLDACKPDAGSGNCVHVRCHEYRMARNAEAIAAVLLIDEQKDVWLGRHLYCLHVPA